MMMMMVKNIMKFYAADSCCYDMTYIPYCTVQHKSLSTVSQYSMYHTYSTTYNIQYIHTSRTSVRYVSRHTVDENNSYRSTVFLKSKWKTALS